MKAYQVLIVAIGVSVTLAEPFQKIVLKNAQSPDGRIVGGSDATRYQFPYQVLLYGESICGGSILIQEWVLTAAHCVDGSIRNLKVIAGLLKMGENHPDVQTVGVSQKIIHPQHPGGDEAHPNDIALLRLSSPLKFTQAVQPIALPQENEEFSGIALISGWGRTSSSSGLPNTLQRVEIQMLSHNECVRKLSELGDNVPLEKTLICVHGEGKSACSGDSGGPLMQNGKLLGVASWVIWPCGSGPSAYTKVSSFIDFIKEHVPNV